MLFYFYEYYLPTSYRMRTGGGNANDADDDGEFVNEGMQRKEVSE